MGKEIEVYDPTNPRIYAYQVGVELARQQNEQPTSRRHTHTRRRVLQIINMEQRIVMEEEVFEDEDIFGNYNFGR
ncbi:hypothetical protein ACIQBJ_32060 [Kitasatospora sp. NPDC088391]|uniref:hypothetical protein n=1 Tax=Kitasatospora sp. NPDC088391 TaxID=3364074 RepID=UPI00381D9223